MKNSLRRSADFQRVYRNGKRYEGSLITVFTLPNTYPYHRLGITASRKALGQAVERNRAKRLLRETFRNATSLNTLRKKYDWVLNGRRRLLSAKVKSSIADFEKIVFAVANNEAMPE